ncbi:hypothetical protein ASJ81_01570 [Methanosarcina spelaei]|uniref:Uncharacterized protein n=1 Tax=Methanosarcina spelaei TaxID=1036679 RepID=A0A2A2HT86_9EURY|nr:hypothetical protein ASJ81_01570 [Methanosarcina spelaei]
MPQRQFCIRDQVTFGSSMVIQWLVFHGFEEPKNRQYSCPKVMMEHINKKGFWIAGAVTIYCGNDGTHKQKS